MRIWLVMLISASALLAAPKKKVVKILAPGDIVRPEPPPGFEAAERLHAALKRKDRAAIAKELGTPLHYQGLETEDASCSRELAPSGDILRKQDLDEFARCLLSMMPFSEDSEVFLDGNDKGYG